MHLEGFLLNYSTSCGAFFFLKSESVGSLTRSEIIGD